MEKLRVPTVNYSADWYGYGLNKLLINIDKLKKIFGKDKINVMDIMRYIISHRSPGVPRILYNNIEHLKDRLKTINTFISKGIWLNDECVVLAKTTEADLDNIYDIAFNATQLELSINLLINDLYNSYFQYTNPDIELPIPRLIVKYGELPFDIDPTLYNVHTEKNKIKNLIEELKPYAKHLEAVHKDIINLLFNKINNELTRIINILKYKSTLP